MTSISGASCCAAFAAHRILYDNHVVAQIIHIVPNMDEDISMTSVDAVIEMNADVTSV